MMFNLFFMNEIFIKNSKFFKNNIFKHFNNSNKVFYC